MIRIAVAEEHEVDGVWALHYVSDALDTMLARPVARVEDNVVPARQPRDHTQTRADIHHAHVEVVGAGREGRAAGGEEEEEEDSRQDADERAHRSPAAENWSGMGRCRGSTAHRTAKG